jgi:hypothetical protein
VKCKKILALHLSPERRGMVFIKTGGVLAGSAGYFFNLAGYGRDIGGVSQLMETQLAKICNSTVIELCKDIF